MNQVIDGQKTLDRHLVEFVDVLRNVGVKISLGSSLDFGLAGTFSASLAAFTAALAALVAAMVPPHPARHRQKAKMSEIQFN